MAKLGIALASFDIAMMQLGIALVKFGLPTQIRIIDGELRDCSGEFWIAHCKVRIALAKFGFPRGLDAGTSVVF